MAKSFLCETADVSELLDAVSSVRALKTEQSLIFNHLKTVSLFPTSRLNLKIRKSRFSCQTLLLQCNFMGKLIEYCIYRESVLSKSTPAMKARLTRIIGNSCKLQQNGCLCLMRRGNNSSGQFRRCHQSEGTNIKSTDVNWPCTLQTPHMTDHPFNSPFQPITHTG